MNHIDISDQLRNTYHFDHWIYKRKWWWLIWLWGLQVILVNMYLLYWSAHELLWNIKKD